MPHRIMVEGKYVLLRRDLKPDGRQTSVSMQYPLNNYDPLCRQRRWRNYCLSHPKPLRRRIMVNGKYVLFRQDGQPDRRQSLFSQNYPLNSYDPLYHKDSWKKYYEANLLYHKNRWRRYYRVKGRLRYRLPPPPLNFEVFCEHDASDYLLAPNNELVCGKDGVVAKLLEA